MKQLLLALRAELLRRSLSDASQQLGCLPEADARVLREMVSQTCTAARPADHTAPQSLRHALLTQTLDPGSLYRRGTST